MSAKRVLLLTQFFPPESHSAANRVGAMAEAFSKEFDVRVITLRPSYPSPALFEGFPTERHDGERPHVVERAFQFPPHRGALFARALREHLMSLGLAVRAVPASADIVVASSPSMFLGPVGLALARVKQARFVWDVRDITWRYAKEVVGTSWQVALGTRALEAYMLRVLRRADLLVGATPGVSQVLVESGVEPDKVVTVFNGISEDLLGISQKKVVGSVVQRRPVAAFVGLIGYNQGLGVVLDVARALPGVDFVLAGDGPDLPLLKRRAEKLGVKNVRFMGWLHKKEQLMSLYEESDIFFTHLKSTPTLDSTSISFKLFEYMATGRPFVYAGRGLAVNLLNEIDCAVTVPPEDPRAMSSAISALLQNPERMNDLGRRGRAFVERNFRRDRLMDDLVRTLIARFP